jgi:ATP-dependent RNA helicase DOB1
MQFVNTEMLFGGVFNNLDPPTAAALVSCLVSVDIKNEEIPELSEVLKAPYEEIKNLATKVGEFQFNNQLITEVEEYVNSFSPSLMEIVYQWCNGASFSAISDLTELELVAQLPRYMFVLVLVVVLLD